MSPAPQRRPCPRVFPDVKKLVFVLVSIVSVGCVSSRPRVRYVEAPDPVIGDLHCTAPRLTILEALYSTPDATPRPTVCDASGT